MAEMLTLGIESTRAHCLRALNSPRPKSPTGSALVQTTAEELLTQFHKNGNSYAHYLRRLHNLAVDLGWLAWPLLAKSGKP